MANYHRILIKRQWPKIFGTKPSFFFYPAAFFKGIPRPSRIRRIAQLVLQEHCRMDHLQLSSELSIVITDDKDMAQLNQKYRGKEKSTDVLSFGLVDFPRGSGTFQLGWKPNRVKKILAKLPQHNGLLPLGDIVISCPRCIYQAGKTKTQSLRQSVQEEFVHLLIHGILHLFGYDHEKKREDRLRMEKRERELYAYSLSC